MIKNLELIFLLSLAFLTSCNDSRVISENEYEHYTIKKFEYNDFENEKNLTGSKLLISELLYPELILALEDYLVITETRSDTIFHIINKKDLVHIRRTGKAGIAPTELNNASILFKGIEKNQFWAYSVTTKTLAKYNTIDSIIFSIEEIKPKNDEMYLASTIVPSSNHSFLSKRTSGDEKFVEFDFDGQILNTFDNWKNMLTQENIPSNVISSLFQGKLVTNEIKSHFVLACLDVDVLEILDKNTGKITSVRGPLHHIPKFNVDYSAGYPMCALDLNDVIYKYMDVSILGNKIYAAFSGHSFETIDLNNEDKMIEQILVFDLEGNPLIKYNLDKSISHFTVDEDKIYGITYDEHPNLIIFNL